MWKLEISLFRFDKDSDYLPYYTKHFLISQKGENSFRCFKEISKKEFSFWIVKMLFCCK